MPGIDPKLWFAAFLRRLPHFLVIAAVVSAVGFALAAILPPTYRSTAAVLLEPRRIPGDLAPAADPREQARIVAERILTRPNLLALADRVGLHGDAPGMTPDDVVGDMRARIAFIGREPDATTRQGVPGATIIGVAFAAPDAQAAVRGAGGLVDLVLAENVRLRTDRAGDTADVQAEVDRLSGEIERQSARIAEMKRANADALPDSLAARRALRERDEERLRALEREEAGLRSQRAAVVRVFERAGPAGAPGPEEQELDALRAELRRQRTIYSATSPQVRFLEARIAALAELVAERRADTAGDATVPTSELEIELAPIDARLERIAGDRARIAATLAELDASIAATPANERTLADLERGLAALAGQREAAVASVGQAAIGARIEVLAKGERFSLVEPPTEPAAPASPDRAMIAGAGVGGGVVLGLGIVALLERLNRSIRPAEIAARTGAPPFATIPHIRTRRERRRRRAALAAALAAMAIPLALLAARTLHGPLPPPEL